MSSDVLILVDGTCVFCTGLVQRILRHRRGGGFKFAHLQSPTARALLARHGLTPDIDTIYAITDYATAAERVWMDGQAGRRIWPRLYPVAWLLWLVPLWLLDLHYRLFARVRYRLFGQAPQCIAPTQAERARSCPEARRPGPLAASEQAITTPSWSMASGVVPCAVIRWSPGEPPGVHPQDLPHSGPCAETRQGTP